MSGAQRHTVDTTVRGRSYQFASGGVHPVDDPARAARQAIGWAAADG